ncbi:MAG: glycosyltransferase family 4 protein [Verrucomicrobiales bacterium]|nr:glycosyltransferase family 4 protein [Verrucomicrobiales bacterium]
MRIVHLIKHCNHANGNAHVAIDLACVQSMQGHAVVYASAGGDYEGLLAAHGVTLEKIDQSGRSLGSVPKVLSQLVSLCKRHKPHLIHAHMMSSAVFGWVVSMITGVPLITTVHNSFDRHSILMRLGRIVAAVSTAEKELLQKRGFKAERLVAILNGPNRSPREKWHAGDREPAFATPCVTMACGLHQRKGVHDAISAFSGLHSEFPQWHLNIIGDGPDRAKLEAITGELGATKFIHFLGGVWAPQSLLRKSAIFVSASYAEPCGLSIAEARDAGCAVIGSAVGGTPELLEHGKAGRLVQPGHPKLLASELRRLMSDPNELRAWRVRSKTGSDYFNVFRLAEDYQRVYERLREL